MPTNDESYEIKIKSGTVNYGRGDGVRGSVHDKQSVDLEGPMGYKRSPNPKPSNRGKISYGE